MSLPHARASSPDQSFRVVFLTEKNGDEVRLGVVKIGEADVEVRPTELRKVRSTTTVSGNCILHHHVLFQGGGSRAL
jgi:hypothetical protein